MKRESRRTLPWFLAGAAFGAVTMYFLDSSQGRRRRAWFIEKSSHFGREAAERSRKLSRHLANKAKGVTAELAHLTHKQEPIDNETLTRRVRSEFGRIVRHPKPIEVYARDGVVTLSGPVLLSEVDHLLDCVRSVAGVRELINHLDVFESAENIPALQGEGKPYIQ